MKRKPKAIISLLLAVLMMATVLAGCGGTASSTPSQSTAASSASGSSAGDDSAGPIELPYTGEEVVFKGFGYDGLAQEDTVVSRAWQEHIGNIKVEYEFIPYNDFLTKMDIYLASGDIPDILPVYDPKTVVNTYGASGALLDFNQYIDYMPNLQEYRKTYPNMDYLNTAEGNRYAIVGVQPIDYAGESWFVNMDELKKAGVEKAPETVDELLAAMRAVKEKDSAVTPFLSYWNISYAMGAFANLINAQTSAVYYDTEDDTYKFAYNEESSKRKELIQLMADMYAEGLVNREIATLSDEQAKALLAQGQWAFTYLYGNSLEKEVFKVDRGEELPFDIQPMTPPAASDGKRYLSIAYQHDNVPGWGIVCSSQTEHPELLAAYMDQVVSPFGRDIFNYGVEGVTYDIVDGKPVMKEGIDKAEMGVSTQYEVWMVGMGPNERNGDGYLLSQASIDLSTENFNSGNVEAVWPPVHTLFSTEAGEQKANIENTLKTYVDEQEAMFIYGQRSMSEWDAFVEEVNNLIDVQELLNLYNNAETILRDSPRVFQAS